MHFFFLHKRTTGISLSSILFCLSFLFLYWDPFLSFCCHFFLFLFFFFVFSFSKELEADYPTLREQAGARKTVWCILYDDESTFVSCGRSWGVGRGWHDSVNFLHYQLHFWFALLLGLCPIFFFLFSGKLATHCVDNSPTFLPAIFAAWFVVLCFALPGLYLCFSVRSIFCAFFSLPKTEVPASTTVFFFSSKNGFWGPTAFQLCDMPKSPFLPHEVFQSISLPPTLFLLARMKHFWVSYITLSFPASAAIMEKNKNKKNSTASWCLH